MRQQQQKHIINSERLGYKKQTLANGCIVIKNYEYLGQNIYWGSIAVIITPCLDDVVTTLYYKGGAKRIALQKQTI